MKRQADFDKMRLSLMPHGLYIGIDLGGTNFKVGVIDERGSVLKKISVATKYEPDEAIADMIGAVTKTTRMAGIGMADVRAIGIASPGSLSNQTGVVLRCANLPGWKNVPLCDRISDAFGKPILIENDASAAAFAEFTVAARKNSPVRNMVLFTLGTGIGAGIIMEGSLIHGHTQMAGELGHMIVVPNGELCSCGQHGCLEMYASASQIGRQASHALQDPDVRSSMRNALTEVGDLTSLVVEQHARQGDTLALSIWNRACYYLAIACINITHSLDPQAIVFGGGMAGAGEFLVQPIQRYFKTGFWNIEQPQLVIRTSELKNDAGIIGAATLARKMVDDGTTIFLGTSQPLHT